jgi:hypothetical protein
MQTLANSVDLTDIVERLQSTKAEDRGLWGVMNASEMLCHLRGPFGLPWANFQALSLTCPCPGSTEVQGTVGASTVAQELLHGANA